MTTNAGIGASEIPSRIRLRRTTWATCVCFIASLWEIGGARSRRRCRHPGRAGDSTRAASFGVLEALRGCASQAPRRGAGGIQGGRAQTRPRQAARGRDRPLQSRHGRRMAGHGWRQAHVQLGSCTSPSGLACHHPSRRRHHRRRDHGCARLSDGGPDGSIDFAGRQIAVERLGRPGRCSRRMPVTT